MSEWDSSLNTQKQILKLMDKKVFTYNIMKTQIRLRIYNT